MERSLRVDGCVLRWLSYVVHKGYLDWSQGPVWKEYVGRNRTEGNVETPPDPTSDEEGNTFYLAPGFVVAMDGATYEAKWVPYPYFVEWYV